MVAKHSRLWREIVAIAILVIVAALAILLMLAPFVPAIGNRLPI